MTKVSAPPAVVARRVMIRSTKSFGRIKPATALSAENSPAKGVLHDTTPDFVPLLRREWKDFSGASLPGELVSALSPDEPTFVGREIAIRHRHHVGLIFLTGRPRGSIDSLSNRELGVARLIAGGFSYKEIARALLLAPATVRRHLQTSYARLGVRTKIELLRMLADADGQAD